MTSKIAVLLIALVLFQMVAVAGKQSNPMTDDTITDQVRLKLTSDPDVKGGALQVDVKSGVVTLSGSVELPKQRDKAEKIARKVKGVKSVVNKIEVKARVPGK
jgi:hyperosmotically inducible periplasmic protein